MKSDALKDFDRPPYLTPQRAKVILHQRAWEKVKIGVANLPKDIGEKQ